MGRITFYSSIEELKADRVPRDETKAGEEKQGLKGKRVVQKVKKSRKYF